MKILLLTWGCDADNVSEAKIAHDWVSNISRNHDVTLFAVSRPERFGCVKEQFPDIPVIEWCDIKVPEILKRFRSIAKPGYLLYFWKARKFLKGLVQQNSFDIIHHLNPFAWRYPSPAYGLGIPLVRGPVAGGLSTPPSFVAEVEKTNRIFSFLRKSDKWRKKFDRVLIESYRKTDCVLVAAPYIVDILKPLPLNRLEIEIEHGMNRCQFEPITYKQHVNKEKIQLLYVGRIVRTKGLRDAIRAISLMKNREKVEFNIIGDGDDIQNCRKETKTLGLENIINFRGWCSRDIVTQAYKDSDIFLFPSFREPTGGVLLEAMIYSLPIITCDYGGPSYLVDDNSGIKVFPCEKEAFIKKISEGLDLLVSNEELREKMGQCSRLNALKRFEWDNKMDRLTAIYESVVKAA